MLEDHRRPEPGDLLALAEPVQQAGVQVVEVLDADVQDEVLAAPWPG
ncbi:hypothetical protein [Actinomadura sp. B10D3]